jgi:hypothetical protein
MSERREGVLRGIHGRYCRYLIKRVVVSGYYIGTGIPFLI